MNSKAEQYSTRDVGVCTVFQLSVPKSEASKQGVIVFKYMETEINDIGAREDVLAPLKQVTPVSKYLALLLFIMMPFIGGFIGYNYAPEKIIEIERVVIKDVEKEVPATEKKDNSENFQALFQSQYGTDTEIELLYQNEKNGFVYFKTLTYGSKPSRIIGYNPETKSFSETDFYVDFAGSEAPSLNGRFITNVVDHYSPTTSVDIIDLETESKVKTINVSNIETLWSSECGYAGPIFDLEWVGSSTLKYGVYAFASIETEGCEIDFVEDREEKF